MICISLTVHNMTYILQEPRACLKAMSSWILDTLRRVVCDLTAYQNGEQVPLDVIESFLITLERVYRELLMKESINSELTSGEREACELIHNSMAMLFY